MSAPVANLADFVSAADVERLQGPIDQAVGLPGRAYGEAFYRLEQRSLFPRGWCVVGVGAQVPEPGDVMPIDLAGWPLLAIRSNAGEVRCFHNICRHRANKLVHEPGTGHKRLSCSWHGWTYDLEGRLVSTPDLGGGGVQEAPGFCRGRLDCGQCAPRAGSTSSSSTSTSSSSTSTTRRRPWTNTWNRCRVSCRTSTYRTCATPMRTSTPTRAIGRSPSRAALRTTTCRGDTPSSSRA